MTFGRGVLLALIFIVAAIAQGAWGWHAGILWARPDLLLIVAVCVGVLLGPVSGVFAGFGAGLMMAVLAGINYGSFFVSRVITGTLSGWLQGTVIRDSILVPPLTVFFATFLCEGLYFLMAPDLHHLRWWVRMVFGEALFNMVLSLPVYFGLRALGYGLDEDALGYVPVRPR
jgi:cell shape-determining protein MreD